MTVRSRPHGLNHVSQVEAAGLEGAVAQHGQCAEARRECGGRNPDR
jgi:hypothetical protein